MYEKYQIIKNSELAPRIKEMDIYTPLIAKVAKPGQFVIVMPDEKGERVPLTLVDWDHDEGWIRLVFLEIGVTTMKIGMKKVNEKLFYVVGPLGNPSHIEKYGTVVMVGGGVGVPALYPIARALKKAGNYIISIIGAKTANLLVYEDRMREVSDELYVTTDDGSKGFKGFTTDVLRKLLEEDRKIDVVWSIGPAIMMKVCSDITRNYKVKTIVSLNSLMVCGMGMCGACRITVGGETKFTCVDGPEFNGHLVDWNELLLRLNMYRKEEEYALKKLRGEENE
ncbi:MAG: sulfide/dihydroorotate dehydrogenase-like FAD/NAD-binding protein [Thermoprotei archaeon]|nr:MAG: sulfide/dihydroorotate dehydrogenase-like FAD/NAD-binding protein [Thermoprotei archaeon]